MILDKEEHRAIFTELLDKAQFPGVMRNIVFEIGEALKSATIVVKPEHAFEKPVENGGATPA